MDDRSTHMAVIGAGPVGLAVARALLHHSIPYEQLEADDDLGGNWYHGVYETAHIISSRKTTEYAEVDPHKALRQMRYAKYTLPLLLRKERKLRQRISGQWAVGSRQ
jgi:cation diffusion facilitator CzcD-associated flavoprotein CzcO